MLPYIRSLLVTLTAIVVALAITWPDKQVAAGAPAAPAAPTSPAPVYFAPDAQGEIASLHVTSANLDEEYTRRARSLRAGSGLDAAVPLPSNHLAAALRGPRTIPLDAALAQVARVAAARGKTHAELTLLVERHAEYAPLGAGAPVVNLPLLNLALDALD